MRLPAPSALLLRVGLLAALPALAVVACSSNDSNGNSSTGDGGDDATSMGDSSQTGDDAETGSVTPGDASGGPDGDASPTDAPSGDGGEAGAEGGGGADGGDASPGADTGAGEGGSGGADAGDASTTSDGAPGSDGAADGPSSCNSLTNSAPVVVSTIGVGAPPAATGGTIASGTYYQTGYVVYPSVDAGSNGIGLGAMQQTVVISGTLVNVVQAISGSTDGGVGALQYLTETLSPSGTSLTVTVSCGEWNGGTFPYSANTTSFQILIGGALLTFTKQ